MGVDRVGDAGDLLSLEQGTGLCLTFEPTAASDIIDAFAIEHTFLLTPDAGREIIAGTSAREQTTVVTGCGKMATTQSDMTERRSRPDVVHRPDHRFTRAQYLPDSTKREHTLIDPMEVDHVGLTELRQTGDIGASIGDVDLEKMTTGKVQTTEDDEALPEEIPMEQR